MAIAYLLLGTNVGDRLANLQKATRLLQKDSVDILNTSKVYVTEPWGYADQQHFFNQALEVKTTLSPSSLMADCLKIEALLGRTRNGKWTPRIIDIDILFYDRLILKDKALTLPHPRMHERNFALIPMLELNAEYIHPVYNMTIKALCKDSKDKLEVSAVCP